MKKIEFIFFCLFVNLNFSIAADLPTRANVAIDAQVVDLARVAQLKVQGAAKEFNGIRFYFDLLARNNKDLIERYRTKLNQNVSKKSGELKSLKLDPSANKIRIIELEQELRRDSMHLDILHLGKDEVQRARVKYLNKAEAKILEALEESTHLTKLAPKDLLVYLTPAEEKLASLGKLRTIVQSRGLATASIVVFLGATGHAFYDAAGGGDWHPLEGSVELPILEEEKSMFESENSKSGH